MIDANTRLWRKGFKAPACPNCKKTGVPVCWINHPGAVGCYRCGQTRYEESLTIPAFVPNPEAA